MADTTDTERDIASVLDGTNLVIVSNRQPYKHQYETDESGERTIVVDRPAGGLTAGLDPVMQETDGTWIAWGDGDADEEVTDEHGRVRMPPEDPSYTLKRVWLSEEEVQKYYYGYSNRVLWPLCHGGLWQTDFGDEYWEQYREVNDTFADAVIEEADENSMVWFQDYHFTLAPGVVRERLPDAFVMQFWHITWPAWDTFRSLPYSTDVLEGLLGNDLLGFHTEQYCRNFLDCVDEALEDAIVDHSDLRVAHNDHITKVEAFPLSVDIDSIEEKSRSFDESDWEEFRREYGITNDERIALGVDRLDYTKGIPERLNALSTLWENKPEWRGELTYVQKASESRSLIPEYKDLQQEVKESVERINNTFGTETWTPIVYIEDMLPEEQLYGAYRHSDVLLVSAVRDGMNLVAKEFVSAQLDESGVLVLSDQTGVYEEFGDDAVCMNPHDVEGFADAIETALTMDTGERRERMHDMREHLHEYDLHAWMFDVFSSASTIRSRLRESE